MNFIAKLQRIALFPCCCARRGNNCHNCFCGVRCWMARTKQTVNAVACICSRPSPLVAHEILAFLCSFHQQPTTRAALGQPPCGTERANNNSMIRALVVVWFRTQTLHLQTSQQVKGESPKWWSDARTEERQHLCTPVNTPCYRWTCIPTSTHNIWMRMSAQ